MNAMATGDSLTGREPLPELSACPDDVAMSVELRVFTKDWGAKVRFISDGADPGPGAALFDTSLYDSQDEANRVARVCDDFLRQSYLGADGSGWHPVPQNTTCGRFVPTLLAAARNRVWSEPSLPVAAALDVMDEPEPGRPSILVLGELTATREPRQWSRRKEARMANLIGQGLSCKQVAYHPEIRSTPDVVYQRASRLGLSFRESPSGHISCRLGVGYLAVFDRAAAAAGQTREAFMTAWLQKAASNPARFQLHAI